MTPAHTHTPNNKGTLELLVREWISEPKIDDWFELFSNDWGWYGDFYNLFTIFARLMFSETFFPSLVSFFYKVIWDLLNDDDSLHFSLLFLLLPRCRWHEQSKNNNREHKAFKRRKKEQEREREKEKLTRWSDVIIRKKDDSSNFVGKLCLIV